MLQKIAKDKIPSLDLGLLARFMGRVEGISNPKMIWQNSFIFVDASLALISDAKENSSLAICRVDFSGHSSSGKKHAQKNDM